MSAAPSVRPGHPHDRNHLTPRPRYQAGTARLLAGVAETEENDVTMFAEQLARDRWVQDLSAARTARLAGAIRRRRAAERSSERALRLVRLASLAAQRSEQVAVTGAYRVAR